MKYLFDKGSYLSASLSPEARRERRFYLILQAVLFLLGAFTMWEFLYELCNIIGSIVCARPERAVVQLLRMVPMILTAFGYVYMGIWCLRAYRARTPERRARAWRVNGAVTSVWGAAIALYVVVGVLTGEYASIVEGSPSPLFPLDLLLGGLLFIAYGIVSIMYGRRLEKKPGALPCGVPFGPVLLRGVDRFFYFFAYCIGLCSFAACVYGTWVMDWAHGQLLFNVALWLNYFTAFLMTAVYRLVYVELSEEHKHRAERDLGLLFLLVNALLFALYLVTVGIWNEAPNQNAYGILPIDFTACFNAFLPLMALMNLLSPLSAMIKGIIGKRK